MRERVLETIQQVTSNAAVIAYIFNNHDLCHFGLVLEQTSCVPEHMRAVGQWSLLILCLVVVFSGSRSNF